MDRKGGRGTRDKERNATLFGQKLSGLFFIGFCFETGRKKKLRRLFTVLDWDFSGAFWIFSDVFNERNYSLLILADRNNRPSMRSIF
jgi:hypothetical protein